MFQDARVYSEEIELDGRDPEQDFLQYKESCESLATLMSEIQELKASGAKEGVRIRLKIYIQTYSLYTDSIASFWFSNNLVTVQSC